METATVEKVGNGFVVEFHGLKEKRVALDALGLASVFDEWPAAAAAPVAEVKLITLADVEALAGREPSEDCSHAGHAGGAAYHSPDWPQTLTPGPSPTAEGEGNNSDVERWPTADDGTEYPAVFQGPTANHFEMECPSHGRKRLERAGTNWRCTGKEGKDQCRVMVPASVIGRLVSLTKAAAR